MPLEDSIPEMKQEHRDLLMLLRAALHGTAPSSPPADWDRVLEIARFHQVDLFLYPAVAAWDKKRQPPAELMAGWRMAYFAATVKYEQASRQLREILSALHDAGVPVIPLKGAWLAEKIYAEGAQRPMCDFDLLVKPEALKRAREIFERLGYVESSRTTIFEGLDQGKEIQFRHPSHPMMIELHWRLWNERLTEVFGAENESWVFDDLREDELRSIPVVVFPPARSLIYMAQHIQCHALTMPVRAYLDLALFARAYSKALSLSELEEMARAWRAPFASRFILATAFHLFDFSRPDALSPFIDPMKDCPDRIQLAERTLLELTVESSAMIPLIEDYQGASPLRFAIVGIRKIFMSPNTIRAMYPEAGGKFGLAGGYIARWNFLFGRWIRLWKSKITRDPAVRANVENYNARRDLSAWLHEKDREEPEPF